MGIICGLLQPTSGQVCMYNFTLPKDVSYIHLLTGTTNSHTTLKVTVHCVEKVYSHAVCV
jgi:hypothetical protein